MNLSRHFWMLLACLGVTLASSLRAADTTNTASASRLLELAGQVEVRQANGVAWLAATNGQSLQPGDKLRTGAQSRAALQFSDRSVLRINERTTLEIQSPAGSEQRRFRVPSGSLFFFNRERPSTIEFETPVTTGAIRGTEFVLEVAEVTGASQLAVLDGRVSLTASGRSLEVQSGEVAQISATGALSKSPLIQARAAIQWAIHYPAVIRVADMGLELDDVRMLGNSLAAYTSGDLLSAAATAPRESHSRPQTRFLAALDLAVGRVDQSENRVKLLGNDDAVARALREIIHVTRDTPSAMMTRSGSLPTTASEWLARSYTQQQQLDLISARKSVENALSLDTQFAFAEVRLAELLFAMEDNRAALRSLDHALQVAPRFASGSALRGFILLEAGDLMAAAQAFDQAIALDAGLGNAWWGRGITAQRSGDKSAALTAFQTAAALEPQDASFRGTLGKAFSESGDRTLAEKEFRLSQELDPGNPTSWLYSALHQWQQNRRNRAVRELETSVELNDRRAVFRSRMLLDRDLAVRSASLAAIYDDAGLSEWGRRTASLAVLDDYANHSTHLFLAESYGQLQDLQRFDLRYETTRQSELLIANLLAPPASANLSQRVSQQDYLQFFDPRPFGVSTFSEYRSSGERVQSASAYGSLPGLSYALDTQLSWRRGMQPNDQSDRRDVSLQLKKNLTTQDDLYFQVGFASANIGDVSRHYDPTTVRTGILAREEQVPNIHIGYHRAWSPTSHTLLLFSRLQDSFHVDDTNPDLFFFRESGGVVTSIAPAPGFDSHLQSDFTLYSAEAQHLWQSHTHTWIVGGRFQAGDVDSAVVLNRALTGLVGQQKLSEPFHRENAYLYHQWRPITELTVLAGISYDWLSFPRDTDLVPLASGTTRRSGFSPKVGLSYTPWKGGTLRASYSRSLGGLFFDNDVRLEPTQLAGFNQAYRSLLPESVAGLLPGARFETLSTGFDQAFDHGTYLGATAEWLYSAGDRAVGTLSNAGFLPVPDRLSSATQRLEYRERNLSLYGVQLLAEDWSLGLRYRLSHSQLEGTFPGTPPSASGLSGLQQHERALLHQAGLALHYQHPSGFLGQWSSTWYRQDADGYTPSRPIEDTWQHDLWAGYRWPRRRAELRVGILNLTDQDYRLSPLNYYQSLPRARTFVVNLKLNF